MRTPGARHIVPTIGVALVAFAAATAPPQAGSRPATIEAGASRPCPGALRGIRFYRSSWARWHEQRGLTVHAPHARPRWCAHARRLATHWRARARHARVMYRRWHERTYRKWECVHQREAAWNDDGAPYYGGLQFSDEFEWTFGRAYVRRWGHAGAWPVWAQLVVAERGWRDRGWWPWPNTAHACGLI